MNHIEEFSHLIKTSITENVFIKLSLGNYKGSLEALKNCYVKPILIKQEYKLSFTYRYQTKDIVKNYAISEGLNKIFGFIDEGEFKHATLFTLNNDIILEFIHSDKTILRKNKPTYQKLPSLEHNNSKNRLVTTLDKSYLQQLKITDEKGSVFKNSQDKYKQINHYIELLNPLIKNLPKRDTLHVLDMGAGKGYLTFALYDYLNNILGLKTKLTGVEYRKDLVDLCNNIAKQSGFNDLQFTQGTIMEYDASDINVLIALHACDTATDDAIFKGIKANADLIVVAPCCHKQIRREMEKYKIKNELDFLLKHGIFLERQAEMVTDGFRSLILEYFDYSTKVFQFISEAHTPKNVMIVAEKNPKTETQKKEILQKIKSSKDYFGIGYHQLEKLMGL